MGQGSPVLSVESGQSLTEDGRISEVEQFVERGVRTNHSIEAGENVLFQGLKGHEEPLDAISCISVSHLLSNNWKTQGYAGAFPLRVIG
jgi:hypothetical protein